MPPVRKNKLNSINLKTNTLISINLNSTDLNYNDLNSVEDNKDKNIEKKSKLLDTYFSIVDKPPSPVLGIKEYNTNTVNTHTDSTHKDIDTNEINNIDKQIEILKNTKLTLSEIKNKIDNLYETEYVEIFKIIKGNKEKYTVNNNGIFINVCTLKPITITEITQFLIFSEKNNKLIDKEEEERNIYRELVS